jgi:hypothetical protein
MMRCADFQGGAMVFPVLSGESHVGFGEAVDAPKLSTESVQVSAAILGEADNM